MRRSILKRLLQFIPVLLGITFLVFSLMYLAPGDPVNLRLSAGGITPSPEVVEEMRHEMGLDRPFFVQYFSWLGNMLGGDMGRSYLTDQPVAEKLMKALPYTLKISALSMLLTLAISLPAGIYMAAHRNRTADRVIRFLAFVCNSLPNFIIAIVLLYFFSFKWKLIPILASKKPIGAILPSVTLALVMSSRFVRQVRAATLDELNRDYVVGLRARGIPEKIILYRNVLKNIMVTVMTLTGYSVGALLGGVVLVETIFNWPGLGLLVMEALSGRDYPLVQAFVVWSSLAYMLVNLLTDISYTWFNPQIKDI